MRSHAITRTLLQTFSSFWDLEDLEGLALDKTGFVYAITSHSRDDEGNEKKTREKLVRFRIDGDHVTDTTVIDDLKQALTEGHPVLAAAAAVRDVKGDGGLNIEALSISPDQRRMLIGFRGPLVDGRAIICAIENFADVFESGAKPEISTTFEQLDLGGFGIRGLSYVPDIGEYLVIGGPVSKADIPCGLWRWKGPGAPALRLMLPGLSDFGHAEGVTAAIVADMSCVVMVSDDGDRKSRRDSSYLVFKTTMIGP